jgi:dihydropteroate synthase type 2
VRAHGTKIVGIVNLTEDSFSDGGSFLEPKAAISRALELVRAGADVIELGAASSHPEAKAVDSDREISRLAPVLDALLAEGIALSVDTCAPVTQRYCMNRRVSMINDIDGFAFPALYPELAAFGGQLVIMHSIGPAGRAGRAPMSADLIVDLVIRFFEDRLAQLSEAGIEPSRMILDPGMGLFVGSNPEPSLRILSMLAEIRRRFELPMMVCVSRKSFLGQITGRGLHERGAATLAAETWAAVRGVDYIRTHDVSALRDALVVLRGIEKEGVDDEVP